MTKLFIQIRRPALGVAEYGDNELPAAIAGRATKLLDEEQNTPDPPDSRELVVSIGGDPLVLDVTPGLWGVELALPSGKLLQRQSRIPRPDDTPIVFDIGKSPHEWLSWQFAEGSVPGSKAYDAIINDRAPSILRTRRGTSPVPVSTPNAMRRQRIARSLGTPVIESELFAHSRAAGTKLFKSQVTIMRFIPQDAPEPQERSARMARALDAWRHLVSGLRLESRIDDLPGLSVDQDLDFMPCGEDRWHQRWELRNQSFDSARRFVIINTSRAFELASLPLPWSPRQGLVDEALIELVIDKSDVPRSSQTSLTMRDQQFFGLLSYMKTGGLALAARVAGAGNADGDNLLVDTLREKRQNPLAAAAAGYALLAATDLRDHRSWYPWIDNLNAWFPDVPDGAILKGRLALGRGSGTPDEAKKAFLLAFRRGLPFYSLGLDWLLDGLRQFPEDADCRAAASLVRECGLRSDVSQVFTLLRFQKQKTVKLE